MAERRFRELAVALKRHPHRVDPLVHRPLLRRSVMRKSIFPAAHCIADVAPLIARLPEETVVIDTSNYYPFRDDKIEAIEAGQVESLWVVEQLGRPIAKAWNAIGSASLAHKAAPAEPPAVSPFPCCGSCERS